MDRVREKDWSTLNATRHRCYHTGRRRRLVMAGESHSDAEYHLVVVIAVVLWLLKVFDLLHYVSQFRVGH